MKMWPFSRKQQPETESSNQTQQTQCEDVLLDAKLAGKDIYNRLLKAMQDEKGVHIESFLCALGALAGYACQASVRETLIVERGLSENQAFVIVECKDGSRYFFGDNVNRPLVESQYSVWSLAAGAAQHLGLKKFININEIFQHVTKVVGSEEFGRLRLPEGHNTSDIPYNYVKALWPAMQQVVKSYCTAEQWPIAFGIAVQECIIFGKSVIDPNLALAIVMESAVAMSKVDLKS